MTAGLSHELPCGPARPVPSLGLLSQRKVTGVAGLLTPLLKPRPLASWDRSLCFLLKVLSLPALEAGAHHSLRPPGGRSVLCCQRGWPWPLPGVVFSQERNFYLSYLYLYACGRAEGGRRCSSCLPYLTPLNRTGPASSCFSGVAGLGQCHTRHQVGRDPPAPFSYCAHLPTRECCSPAASRPEEVSRNRCPRRARRSGASMGWAYSSFIDALDTIKPHCCYQKGFLPSPLSRSPIGNVLAQKTWADTVGCRGQGSGLELMTPTLTA